jgi:hypothetical protein
MIGGLGGDGINEMTKKIQYQGKGLLFAVTMWY